MDAHVTCRCCAQAHQAASAVCSFARSRKPVEVFYDQSEMHRAVSGVQHRAAACPRRRDTRVRSAQKHCSSQHASRACVQCLVFAQRSDLLSLPRRRLMRPPSHLRCRCCSLQRQPQAQAQQRRRRRRRVRRSALRRPVLQLPCHAASSRRRCPAASLCASPRAPQLRKRAACVSHSRRRPLCASAGRTWRARARRANRPQPRARACRAAKGAGAGAARQRSRNTFAAVACAPHQRAPRSARLARRR